MAQPAPGAEAWSAEGGDVGVLVLHGFTGNPVSLRPYAEALAKAGFAVELPLLPGHGTTWQDLQRTTWREWAGEAETALDKLRARTRARVVTGLSMGGTLALHLAETRGSDISGLALVNPYIFSPDPRMKLLPVLKSLLPSLPGVGNDIAKPGADEKPYTRIPLKALHSLTELQRLVTQNLGKIVVPTLVFTSRQDHVVVPENTARILAGLATGDKEQVWLDRSYHVATLDYDADLIAERTADFVRRVTTAS
jgi:carboxylesterase